MSDYQKEYRDAKKEKINKKYICPCGGQYNYTGKSNHLESKKPLQ